MNDYPIKVGSMLYTLVDPTKGNEVAYNRWYERDHFYAGCMVGPWLFAGRRWVATKDLKDMRFPQDSTVAVPLDAGSYLATYWVHEGKHDEHFAWASKQVWELYGADRGFGERIHRHTVLFDGPWSFYRDEDPVPIELALDHNYPGLGSVFVDRDPGTSKEDLVAFLNETAFPEIMSEDSPVASVVNWDAIQRNEETDGNAPMDLGSPTGDEHRIMQMFFIDTDPRECWDKFKTYADTVNNSGKAKVVLAAPFIPTDIGTDRYTDQLW